MGPGLAYYYSLVIPTILPATDYCPTILWRTFKSKAKRGSAKKKGAHVDSVRGADSCMDTVGVETTVDPIPGTYLGAVLDSYSVGLHAE